MFGAAAGARLKGSRDPPVESGSPRPSEASRRRHNGYRQLLVVCVLLMGCFALGSKGSHLASLLYNLLPLVLIRGLGQPFDSLPFGPWAQRAFASLGLATLGASLLWYVTPQALRGTGITLLLLWTLFGSWSTTRLVRGLSQERRVTGDVLMGALAGYLLIGLTAGLLFTALESVAPGSFLSTAHPVLQKPLSRLDFLRLSTFAFVTLTTTGYGDMVPVSPAAQMASVTLAIVGNCYLAVVLGLLISRFTVQEQQEARPHGVDGG